MWPAYGPFVRNGSGLNCDRSHQGVTATSPSDGKWISDRGEPRSPAGMDPVLDLGMTYDVAV